jgi:hypothetical protein
MYNYVLGINKQFKYFWNQIEICDCLYGFVYNAIVVSLKIWSHTSPTKINFALFFKIDFALFLQEPY